MLAVNSQCATEIFSHVEKHLDVKVESSVQALRCTTETGFTRV